jgi:hypothetical protein
MIMPALVLALIGTSTAGLAEVQAAAPGPKAVYAANLTIEPLQHRIAGHVQIQFWPKVRERAYVHLYPYAFAEGEGQKGIVWDELLGKRATPGTYHITKLLVQGKPVEGKRTGTVLEVPLDTADKPKESGPVRLDMEFEQVLPRNQARMSYDEHAIWLGNWLPVLAVHDEGGWHLDPYVPMGDPFYSETADYRLQVTLPPGYQLASTGIDHQASSTQTPDGKRRSFFLRADNVRDFALVVLDETYRLMETKSNETAVRTWWRSGDNLNQVKQLHDAAVRSLDYFHRTYGAYPYSEYDVVRTGGRFDGMEYPGLVFVDGSHFAAENSVSTAVVVHETAHQWFYGLVGNDQIGEAWLDEGLTEYAALSFLQKAYPKLAEDRIQRRRLRGIVPADSYAAEGLRPWQPIQYFPDWLSYSDLVYSRGVSMLWTLREAWGEAQVDQVLKSYVGKHRFGVATASELIAAFSEVAGEDATPYFDFWMKLDKAQEAKAKAWLARRGKR